MSSRDNILDRLRAVDNRGYTSKLPKVADIEIFSDYPAANSLLGMFVQKFEALNGEFYSVTDISEAGETILKIVSVTGLKKGITFSAELINQLMENNKQISDLFDIVTNKNFESKELAEYEIGLTTADFLIARTGSVFLRSNSTGGRRLSVLPPIHIVVAWENQLVKSLEDVYNDEKIKANIGSFMTVISGPSRTSDIEKQLVLGAHGPKRLIVIVIK